MKIRSSDKFHERQDKRVRRTHFDKKSDIFYQEMMVFVPIAILLKCIPDKSASRRGFNQNFSRKMTKAYQTECAPNLQYFFAVNFYQSKKEICFRMEVLRHMISSDQGWIGGLPCLSFTSCIMNCSLGCCDCSV